MIIEELIAVLGYEIKNEADLKKFEQNLERATVNVTKFAMRVTSVAGAAAAGFGLLMARGAISAGAEFEKLATTLETIEGSAEKAKASLDWVGQFATKTPFDLKEVSEAFVKLRAYGLDPMDGTLLSIGDAASGMGKNLMQGVEAFADAATGEFERLKEAFAIKAKQSGKEVIFTWQQNGKTLTRTVKKDGAEITKALRDILGSRFAGAMARQSKTWFGLLSNIGDAWLNFNRKIADAGFFQKAKEQIASFLDRIGEMDASGKLDTWAKSISGVLETALLAISGAISGFLGIIERMDDTRIKIAVAVGGLLAAIGIAALPIVGPFAVAAAFAIILGLALDDLWNYMDGAPSKIGDFIKAIQDLTGLSEGVAQGITAGLAGLGAIFMAALFIKPYATVVMAGKLLGAAFGMAFKIALTGGNFIGLILLLFNDIGKSADELTVRMKANNEALNEWAEGSFFGTINTELNRLGDEMRAKADELAQAFLSIDWAAVGRSIVDGIIAGIVSAWGALIDKASALAAQLGSIFSSSAPSAPAAPATPGGARGRNGGFTPSTPHPAPATRQRNGPDKLGALGASGLISPARQLAALDGGGRSQTNNVQVTAPVTVNVAGSNAQPETIGKAASRQVASATQRAVSVAANEPSAA